MPDSPQPAPSEAARLFRELVATRPGLQCVGGDWPCVIHNGHLMALVNEQGVLGLRLPEEEFRSSTLRLDRAPFCFHSRPMPFLGDCPAPLLHDAGGAAVWLARSQAHVASLPPGRVSEPPRPQGGRVVARRPIELRGRVVGWIVPNANLAQFLPYHGYPASANPEEVPEPGGDDPEFQRLVEDIRAGWEAEANPPLEVAPHLPLAAYRSLFRPEHLPTPEQITQFVAYVSDVHSWYKHLPRYLPGETFTLYLDPAAGWNWSRTASGGIEYRPWSQGEQDNRRISTEEWHQRFGLLDWARNARTPPFLHPPEGVRRLPREVLAVAQVRLTALFNESLHLLPLLVSEEPPRGRRLWTGREPEHREALALCWEIEDLREGGGADDTARFNRKCEAEARLEELVRPEYERQQAALRHAVERVVALVRG